MRKVFLDTGYLLALEASDDQHHPEAQEHWRTFIEDLPTLVTTTFIFDEVVTFLNRRRRHKKAIEVGQRLIESPSVHLIYVDESLFTAGWDYFQNRPDKRFSLTDCISFVVMEQEKIEEALSFDAHFEQAGFRRLP